VLVACIILIGFCTGFYIVPLFTLLQAKAPKGSKGELIATSNCVNVTGAIAATILFKLVVVGAHSTGLAPEVADRTIIASGPLTKLEFESGRPVYFQMMTEKGLLSGGQEPKEQPVKRSLGEVISHIFEGESRAEVIDLDHRVKAPYTATAPVDVSKFTNGGITHYEIVPVGMTPTPDYDNRHLPRYLFVGAAILTGLLLLSILGPVTRLRGQLLQETAH
ncbi:MAG: hypothetical protein ACRCZF_22705, partial [Gemmataceae bacterium]